MAYDHKDVKGFVLFDIDGYARVLEQQDHYATAKEDYGMRPREMFAMSVDLKGEKQEMRQYLFTDDPKGTARQQELWKLFVY